MKTPYRKFFKITLLSAACLMLFYQLLLNFPQVFFSKKLEYKSFVVYSHTPLNAGIYKILDRADERINASELAENNKTRHKIFFCSSFGEFTFFTLTHAKAFAINQLLTNNILIAKPNAALNTAERNDSENNTRTLSGVIAHEAMHSFIKNKIGLWNYLSLETWKNEGYCDFIANESSFNFKNGMELLCKSQENSSPSFRYFKYRLYVEYLVRDKKIPFRKLAKMPFNLREIDRAVLTKNCRPTKAAH